MHAQYIAPAPLLRLNSEYGGVELLLSARLKKVETFKA